MKVQTTINGIPTILDAAPGESLMESLRKNAYFSVKHGCETGDCGACGVLVDGLPRATCVMLTGQAENKSITTLESLGTPDTLHPLQEAFVDRGAVQCGYCTPAMVLAAMSLIQRNPDPTVEDVKDALSGTLCRCTGYVKPVEAVLAAAQQMRKTAVTGG